MFREIKAESTSSLNKKGEFGGSVTTAFEGNGSELEIGGEDWVQEMGLEVGAKKA